MKKMIKKLFTGWDAYFKCPDCNRNMRAEMGIGRCACPEELEK